MQVRAEFSGSGQLQFEVSATPAKAELLWRLPQCVGPVLQCLYSLSSRRAGLI